MKKIAQAGVKADLRLSSKGLKNVPMELHEGDFVFTVGDQNHKCNLIVAEFLSPKISRLRKADPSICEYKISTEDPAAKFERLLALPSESDLHVEPEDFNFYVSVSKELENEELLTQLVSDLI